MRYTVLVFMVAVLLSATVSAQDFTIPTPKGDLLVKITSTGFHHGEFFTMDGSITNNTDSDFKLLTLKVAFLNKNGQQASNLCPSVLHCRTVGLYDIQAHQTTPFKQNVLVAQVRNPRLSGYNLSFADAIYGIRYRFTMLKPVPSDALSFDDSQLSFTFSMGAKGIGCIIANKGLDPASINWNLVSYVDASSEAHKIVHSGIRLIQKDASQPPTVVPPMAKITETMIPADQIISTPEGWTEKPLWPEAQPMSKDDSYLKQLEGTTFSLFMPIEIEGKTKNYTFVFKISDVLF